MLSKLGSNSTTEFHPEAGVQDEAKPTSMPPANPKIIACGNSVFPVEIAEKVARVALECVHMDPDKRPDMGLIAGKISKLYLESRIWSDNVRMPTDISVSLAPR